MKKFFGNEKVQKILYGILSFVLAVLIVVLSVSLLLKTTVFSNGFLMDSLNNSAYYTDLCSEITDEMVDIGNASGLNKSFFEGFIDEVMVREDIQSYVDKFYNGEKLSVDTGAFERALRTEIEKYEKKKGIDPSTVSSESIDYFVKEAATIYGKNIKITYFSMIQKDTMKWSRKFMVFSIVSGAAVLALLCFIFFTNKWKHRGIKYISYSTASSGLFLLLIPTAVFASGIIDKVAILSRSLNDLYNAIINSLMVDMLIVGGILIVLSVALVIVHDNLRKKLT